MYDTWRTAYIEPHKSFEAIIQSGQLLVHTYSNSYLPFFTTSSINAHHMAAIANDLYVYPKTLVSI